MLTLLALLGVLGALFLAAALATREDQALAPASPDAADLALPEGPMTPDDVRGVRFGMAVRGYRMREVDVVLDRLAEELAERDRRLAALEGRAAAPAYDGRPAPDVDRATSDLPAPSVDHRTVHEAEDGGARTAAYDQGNGSPHQRDAEVRARR